MARLPQIKIKKLENDSYELIKNENYDHLFGMSSGFFKQILKLGIVAYEELDNISSIPLNKRIETSEKFDEIQKKILNNEELTVVLDKQELHIINEWIQSICEILIEFDTIDLKEERIVKYLKLSQSFTLKLNTILEEKS